MKLELLDIYSDYLISQNHYATSTGLANMFQGEISHGQMTRHLRSKDYSSLNLWCYIKPDVRKNQSVDGVLILDDTISEKPYTDENAINCWHFSHVKHRHFKGINLLSCLVRFRNLVQLAVDNQVLFLNILADSWFGLKANMNFIHHHLNKHFIFAIQSNRCVALSKKEASCGKFQRVDSLYLKDISFPVKLLTKIFTNEDVTSGTLYLISNDLGHDADRMYQVYQTITN